MSPLKKGNYYANSEIHKPLAKGIPSGEAVNDVSKLLLSPDFPVEMAMPKSGVNLILVHVATVSP